MWLVIIDRAHAQMRSLHALISAAQTTALRADEIKIKLIMLPRLAFTHRSLP
jgi:hypothetical protein